MTYATLKKLGAAVFAAKGYGAQQLANLASALNLWRKVLGRDESAIAKEFGITFDGHFRTFQDEISESHAPRTQRDRAEQILQWRSIFRALAQNDALPASFSAALQCAIAASGQTQREISRLVGIDKSTMSSWIKGHSLPASDSLEAVKRLEEELTLAPGALTRRVPPARTTRFNHQKNPPKSTSPYSERSNRRIKELPRYRLPFTERIAAEWKQLYDLKSDNTRDGATLFNTWRSKPIAKTSLLLAPEMVFGDKVCPSAKVQWNQYASYLGYLALPAPDGPGIPAEQVDTLSCLLLSEHIDRYVRWWIRRSGDIVHNGIPTFLNNVNSLLRPETGFIYLSPWLAKSLPQNITLPGGFNIEDVCNSDHAWQQLCIAARDDLRKIRKRFLSTKKIRRSRDPEEQIRDIVSDAFPLRRLVEFVDRLVSSEPPMSHVLSYNAWLRDVVLCKLLISNPMRVGQLASMTWQENNFGNLYRSGHTWRIRFDPSDFKNEKGAASEPYDVEVDESVWPWIKRYLSEARPLLAKQFPSNRFLLPTVLREKSRQHRRALEQAGISDPGGFTSHALSLRIKYLTTTYIPGCVGFGPHAVRHIIATDHLKRNSGDYLTVAILLHDTLQTVLKNYAHLKTADGLRTLSRGLRLAEEEIKMARPAGVA